jgi:hypothetical protein
MTVEPQPEAPVVFISYSHDSEAHKEWVRNLATALRQRFRIEVVLDQWEIGPGDDVPKFMEQSVRSALRVLMVCTEPYVRKVDDGKGGAGYEAMVVTGELIADLGTRKFIPVMRQPGGRPVLPACVSTRFYVDFSNDDTFDARLEDLARDIHQSPKFEKPPLGLNPFAATSGDLPAPSSAQQPVVELVSDIETYQQSKALADTGDFARWREFIHREKASSARSLLEWRSANQDNLPHYVKDLPDYFLPAVSTHANLFAAAFGAFDSKDQRFHNQLSLIDTIREPKGWARNGTTVYVELPDLTLFIYQALMGGLAISRHNFDAALKLAATPLEDQYSGKVTLPLFKSSWAMGWPESMGHDCTIAWGFLLKVVHEWTWLHELFGSEEDTTAAIAAYYAFLNTLDFISATKAVLAESSKEQAVTVPACFVMVNNDTKKKAKSLFFADSAFLGELFKDNSITSDLLAVHWFNWMDACQKWIFEVYRTRILMRQNSGFFHADLPRALLPAQGKKIID